MVNVRQPPNKRKGKSKRKVRVAVSARARKKDKKLEADKAFGRYLLIIGGLIAAGGIALVVAATG